MVSVVSNTGKPLMPTSEYRARKLLKKGRAEIYKHDPFFTIRLLDREDGDTQPVEYATDTGYLHVGISVKSDRHEYLSEQRDLLEGEPERNRDRLIHRRERRNRLRYRKCRFNNRKRELQPNWEKWFPPSLRHKAEQQVRLFECACEVIPITSATFEMGKFDTQFLKAQEAGLPAPTGADYQHGERYGSETLRQALFARDEYTCQICGRSAFKDGAKLHAHHVGFWKGDRSNRLANQMTVCEICHTTANHRPGGLLYGLEPALKDFTGATFMTAVRFELFHQIETIAAKHGVDVHMTYGAKTKCERQARNISKSHANDAYCIGEKHPKHRTPTHVYKKVRRNNRCKEKFYDATYVDLRTGQKTKASTLGCGRTKRNTHLQYENLTVYRGKKLSKGHRSISWGNAPYPCGSVVKIEKTTRKKGTPRETIAVCRKVSSVHRRLSKAILADISAGKPHNVKAEDISWTIEFKVPLPDGTCSTSTKNVREIIKRPIYKGWQKIS